MNSIQREGWTNNGYRHGTVCRQYPTDGMLLPRFLGGIRLLFDRKFDIPPPYKVMYSNTCRGVAQPG